MDHSLFDARESQATAKSQLVRGTNNIMNVNDILLTMFAITSENHFTNHQFAREQKISLLYDRIAIVL